ncbi:MAG TPA: carbamoyltransferase C-terminal domain-containing protein [Acidobacteriaceae bacterium]|nr:carbamoyltransferase C-terminal domain-containing protein [Acidobacteriaceae bacterium]
MTTVARPSATYIVGINAYHGDVSAVLLKDGELVVALEEERFRRIKHWAGFPSIAIQKCLEVAGISGRDVAHVAVSRDPKANLGRKALYALTRRPDLSLILDRARNARKVRDLHGPLSQALGVPADDLPKIHFVEHHPAHLASAFFVSPFEDAAVCAIDGFGDFVSTSMAAGNGNHLQVLERVYFPHSLGLLYTAITQYLGFWGYGDEFKVMGLAPYGKPTRVQPLRELVQLKNDGTFELNLQFFRHWSDGVEMEWDDGYPTLGRVYSDQLPALLGAAREKDQPLTSEHEDLARSLQAVFEECAFHVLNGLWERIRNPRLCLAGGCGMNSVANGKIRERTPFRDVYIQPAAGDNGTALGAAYHVWNQTLGHSRAFVMDHAYWGTEYPAPDVAPLMAAREEDQWEYRSSRIEDEAELCRQTAQLIAEGNVVGWFQGRMEWGSRALGSRSILADPRRADMRDLINTKIKFREKFRPFAPSILEEALHDWFTGASPDPFMQQVYPVRDDRRAVLPAITHVDGSGRLQTVSARTNPRFHRLISAFGALTGVPVVLNTSFNENEPIVDTPEQALDCFLRTRMDAIIMGDTILRRQPTARPETMRVG